MLDRTRSTGLWASNLKNPLSPKLFLYMYLKALQVSSVPICEGRKLWPASCLVFTFSSHQNSLWKTCIRGPLKTTITCTSTGDCGNVLSSDSGTIWHSVEPHTYFLKYTKNDYIANYQQYAYCLVIFLPLQSHLGTTEVLRVPSAELPGSIRAERTLFLSGQFLVTGTQSRRIS